MFKRLADRTDRKTSALRNSQTSVVRMHETLKAFFRDTLGVPLSMLIGAEYTPDHDVVVRVSSKALASNIVLRMTELRADLRTRGVTVRRIVVR